MEIQEKHRLEILNAKCNYVCAVDTLVHKMNYGEDADCCIEKLYLASRLINRLDCYCFDPYPIFSEEVLAEFNVTHSNTSYSSGTIVSIIVNGVQLYAATTTSTLSEKTITEGLLMLIGMTYTSSSGGGIYNIDITAFADTTSIKVIIYPLSRELHITDFSKTTSVEGKSDVSSCYNCVEDSDLPKMYEVLHKLLA